MHVRAIITSPLKTPLSSRAARRGRRQATCWRSHRRLPVGGSLPLSVRSTPPRSWLNLVSYLPFPPIQEFLWFRASDQTLTPSRLRQICVLLHALRVRLCFFFSGPKSILSHMRGHVPLNQMGVETNGTSPPRTSC
jgi:hypothetical protein